MGEFEQLAGQLNQVPYFQNLPSEELIGIVSLGVLRNVKSGEILFHENDSCDGMYVLIRGQVNLVKTGPDGQESILNTINPVTMFNEVPVLDGGPNAVSAQAVSDSFLWRISSENFRKLLLKHPQVSLGMLSVLAKRNRLMLGHYVDLSFRTITARLAKYLLEVSQDGSEVIHRGHHPIREMAAHIVAAPEAVSRTLKIFKMNEVIICNRSAIKIKNIENLRQIARIDI